MANPVAAIVFKCYHLAAPVCEEPVGFAGRDCNRSVLYNPVLLLLVITDRYPPGIQ